MKEKKQTLRELKKEAAKEFSLKIKTVSSVFREVNDHINDCEKAQECRQLIEKTESFFMNHLIDNEEYIKNNKDNKNKVNEPDQATIKKITTKLINNYYDWNNLEGYYSIVVYILSFICQLCSCFNLDGICKILMPLITAFISFIATFVLFALRKKIISHNNSIIIIFNRYFQGLILISFIMYLTASAIFELFALCLCFKVLIVIAINSIPLIIYVFTRKRKSKKET